MDEMDPDLDQSLAGERTYLAWTRTALSLAATGGAVLRLFPPVAVPGARHLLGFALIALGAVAWLTGYLSYEVRATGVRERARRLRAFSLSMSSVALGALVISLFPPR